MKEQNICALAQEKYFLNTFPLIRQIASRNLGVLNADAVEDISQTVALRLWKGKKDDRVLSEEEWRKIANRATQNEIKRFCGSKFHKNVSLSEIEEDRFDSMINGCLQIAGNTDSEVRSTLKYLWKTIGNFSIRQKYALLFQKRDFIFELVSRKCCTIEEIADSLDVKREEFIWLSKRMPLSDEEIQRLLETKLCETVTIKQVWMARGKAKAKLAAALKGRK